MRTDLERDDFLVLLERLKSEEDSEILSAVRDINAKMTVAGVSWDDLLISQDGEREGGIADAHVEKSESDEAEYIDDNFEPLSDEERREAETLINSIRNMKVSDSTIQELDEYKNDISDGEFEKMDLRYLRALKARLSV